MTNKYHTVLYVGATIDLERRVREHREGVYSTAFTRRYNVNKLVWYEEAITMADALSRERQIKSGSRERKIQLIEAMNPTWGDLYEDLLER